jgi:hypothetical protein
MVLPTEETVNSFLFQMFGYDPTVTWKVADIRPSEVPGLAEVSVVITNPQGSNQNRLLVSGPMASMQLQATFCPSVRSPLTMPAPSWKKA